MKRRRAARVPAESASKPIAELAAPPELTARPFQIDGECYAILAFPLPQIELPAELSAAECEVVKAVLDGLSNAEIARRRGTALNTVANQLRSVFSKLAVRSRFELTERCARKPRSKSV